LSSTAARGTPPGKQSWSAALGGCPFSGNLTAFYVTNAGDAAATFKAWLLEDVTP